VDPGAEGVRGDTIKAIVQNNVQNDPSIDFERGDRETAIRHFEMVVDSTDPQ
jgi:hypothetical protein